MGKKKLKWSPSEHSEEWDENERKTERTTARGRDDAFRVHWDTIWESGGRRACSTG